MKRVFLTDGTKSWFDGETAKKWSGKHEKNATRGYNLFRTGSGKWVIECWTKWQNEEYSLGITTDEEAVLWLGKNGHEEAATKYDTIGILNSYEI